ncbi:MAG: prolipoprotein diacylglyceryl transferase [Bacteroidota bacterium]|nr:prolipoprotein diacylglyceryl transferase [Bacteroidota bacterium]
MYPDLSYILHALFGTDPDNIFSIIKTFGLLLGMAFVASGSLLYLELKRRESTGQFNARIENVIIHKPIGWQEILTQSAINFLLAYKIAYIYYHFTEFRADPASVIFSSKGNGLWGLIIGGLTAGYWIYKMSRETDKELKRADVMIHPHQRVFDITAVAALSGIIGSKLFSIFENFGDFLQDPIGNFFSGSGLTIYGGLILAFLCVSWYVAKKGLRPLYFMDAASPSLMIGYAVGRMGCHLSGDGDWGIINEMPKPTWFFFPDNWWAFSYPHNVLNEGIKIEACQWLHCMQLTPPVFPTPLYESILALIITGILWFFRTRIPYAGVLFFLYCLLNGIERIFIESIRVNPRYDILGLNPSFAQIIAFLLILTGITGMVYYWKKKIH